jgi:hypothetical protein
MLFSLIGLSGIAVARTGVSTEKSQPQVFVSVINNANVGASDLRHAEEMASRIYEQAGLSIVWNNCTTASDTASPRCVRAVDSRHLVLRIERQARALSSDAFGVAFVGADGTGAYCDVFYDRIADLHRRGRASEAAILAVVAAHELGHLLLGSHSHSSAGIMRPQLPAQEFSTPEIHFAAFSHDQSQKIANRLEQSETISKLF